MEVTVAIPCYNGAPHVGRCIEAILQQTRPPDAVLVVDDGSTDESTSIISKYPVELVRHESNMGLSRARNTALHHTQTSLILYVDVDAYADEGMVAAILPDFENQDAAGVGGQGIEAVRETLFDQWRAIHASQGYGQRKRTNPDHLFGLCMAYRSAILKSIGGFDPFFRTNGEDMDIGFRMRAAGHKLVYTPAARVFHQRKDNHTSLRRMMYQWYYWAFVAKRKNGLNPWSLAGGTLRRMVWSDTIKDLIFRKSLDLARLDLEMSIVKLNAIFAAARHPLPSE